MIRTAIDYATFPLFLATSMLGGWLLLERGVPNLLVTPIVVGALVVVAALLERLRPERAHLPRELPLWLEAAHFVFNFELGYGLALGASWLLERALRMAFASPWPASWPLALQLLLAVTLYEATSYWQHRLFHERARLWSFHFLHHSGARLDMLRAARFHFVDFSTVAFLAYLPLVVLGCPEDVVTLLAILVSALGIMHHGNIRARTPVWLDYLICTPAIHRRHHSRNRAESDANYANTVMCFDLLFGTFARPDPVGPAVLGTDDDPLPAGFWAQLLGPFRR
jgi:ornithine lipid hydroxylase